MPPAPTHSLAVAQGRVLDRLVAGAPLADTLTDIVREIEALLPATTGSILLLEDGRLLLGAAPGLPDEYNRAIHGLVIGPEVGSCGTAAHRNVAVVVADIATDSLWSGLSRELALVHGLRACWSVPIRGRAGGVLGTFALYYREPLSPTADELALVESCASLASVAIELDRAATERERVEGQLRHAQKLESLGVMAGGIAHDFNNLLTAILGHAGLALEALPPEAPAVENVRGVEAAALRAAELVQQLLAYAGRATVAALPLDLSELVRDTSQLLRTVVAKTATLQFHLADGLTAVEGDPAQLRQVVMNLLTNASESLGDAPGTVTLRTGVRVLDDPPRYSPYAAANLPPGRYAFVEVADTGVGMTPQTQARIFDPFFSTKFTGRGLGLAATLGIVRKHRGLVRVDSKPGRGTTFEVLFPAIGASDAGRLVELATDERRKE